MIPLKIEGATICMKAPPGMEGEVRDLHVARIDGAYVSAWEPTPGELEMLNAGGSVVLWIIGGQPPVLLTVKPHAEVDDAETR